MRIIIAGGREFDNYYLLRQKCIGIIEPLLKTYSKENIKIISGGARGADRLGKVFAEEFKLSFKEFPANWDKYGKPAGYRRNVEMANYAKEGNDCMLIVFWDKVSKGTKHMIDIAKEKNIKTEIIYY